MDLRILLFGHEGRIGRRDFWIGIVVLFAANVMLGAVAWWLGWAFAGIDGALVLSGVVGLLLAYPSYCIMVKRSNDRAYPQVYVQALFAVLLSFQIMVTLGLVRAGETSLLTVLVNLVLFAGGLWALVDLGFIRGTAGPNLYGPDPVAPGPP